MLRQEGLDRWLVLELTPENWPDHAGDSALARFPVLRMSVRDLVDSSPQQDVFVRRRRLELGLAATAQYVMTPDDSARFKAMNDLGNRRVNEYLGAKLERAVTSDHQLEEVMTDFWENHFSVFRGKMPTQFTLLEYDRDVIRPHVLGKFRDLLGAVAHSAAMLYYLDNFQSNADSAHLTLPAWHSIEAAKTPADAARIRAAALRRRGGLNENYGRELMELHTLGVDGGYTQQDVINVARALTGWTLQTPREGGEFTFNPGAHDAETKLVLGHVLKAGRGTEDGEEVLDIVSRHPSTARFIATKLVRHFVADTAPPELVRRVAATFLQTNGDIREMMAVIVSSPEFYRKSSFLVDSLGKTVFSPLVEITEDPLIPRGQASSPFDEEGVATHRRTVVCKGVLQGYFLGSYSARKLGLQTTGNAGGTHNLLLASTGEDFAQLLKKMGRGLLVTELLGSGINMVTGDYSRGAAGFWVENGEIAYPVQEITVAGNLKDMFLGMVAAGTDVVKRGSKQCGSVLIERMTVAGD